MLNILKKGGKKLRHAPMHNYDWRVILWNGLGDKFVLFSSQTDDQRQNEERVKNTW